jgi:hypothetical protein
MSHPGILVFVAIISGIAFFISIWENLLLAYSNTLVLYVDFVSCNFDELFQIILGWALGVFYLQNYVICKKIYSDNLTSTLDVFYFFLFLDFQHYVE